MSEQKQTLYAHVQMGTVDKSGNLYVMYPTTTAEDILIKKNDKMPADINTMQDLCDNLNSSAFNNSDTEELVYLGEPVGEI